MKGSFVIVVLVAVMGLFVYALTHESGDPALASPLVGKPAPTFSMPVFGEPDSTVALTGFRGRPVVLNFWASWCLSCRAEARVLEAGWKRHGDEVAFLGVAVSDEEGPAREFIRRHGKTYYLGPDADGTVAVDYGLFGVPETYFIDPEGNVLAKHVGPVSADVLERRIEELKAGEVSFPSSGDPEALTPIKPSTGP